MGITPDEIKAKCERYGIKDAERLSDHELKVVVHNYEINKAVKAMLNDGCSVIEVVGTIEMAKSAVVMNAEREVKACYAEKRLSELLGALR